MSGQTRKIDTDVSPSLLIFMGQISPKFGGDFSMMSGYQLHLSRFGFETDQHIENLKHCL